MSLSYVTFLSLYWLFCPGLVYDTYYRILQSETKGPHHMHSLRSSCMLHKDVSIQRRRRPCSGSSKSRSKAYLVTLAEIQDTPACEVARSHSSCILSFDLIGQHQNKRFYGTKIVLPLAVADAIFRRERSDDRKCVCCSQAINCPDEHKN